MDHPGHMSHATSAGEDRPASHGMAVVGVETIFLSHLAMFHSPHDYQVLMQVAFGKDDAAYRDDRKKNPATLLYTFAPAKFVLTQLFPGPSGEPPALTTITGSLVRNHFEQPDAHPEPPVEISSDVVVDVIDVLYHNRFDPHASALEHLSYVLFGRGSEIFLAHRITKEPDFDQLIAVGVRGVSVSDEQLAQGVDITVTGRPNTHDSRVRDGEKVTALARIDGRDTEVEIDAGVEVYVETNDFT